VKLYRRLAGLGLIAFGLIGLRVWGQEAQEPSRYPLREIDRPLVLPVEVSELRVGLSYFDAEKYFDADGESVNLKDPEEWRLLIAELEIGYGLFEFLEVGAGIPYYSGKIFQAEGANLGDLYAYTRFKILQNQEKTRELAFDFKASFPIGDADIDMALEKKRYFQENLRTGDPNVDFFGALLGRWTFQKFALRAGWEYGYRLEGEIKTGMESLEDVAKFDPGESSSFNVDFLYQVMDKLVAGVGLEYLQQDENKLEGQGLNDDWYLWELKPEIEIQFGKDYDLLVQSAIPLSGKNQPNAYPIIILWKSRI